MPIHLNLLAEARVAEELRRRDPVKRILFVGALLVALALVWSSSLLVDDMLASKNVSQVEIEFQTHTNEYARVLDAKSKAADIAKKLEALQKLSQARLLQGSLMNALQQISVPSVQLTRLRVEHAYTYLEAIAPKTGEPGSPPSRPASCTEKVVLMLDAKDASAIPGDQVPKFKDAVANHHYFQDNLDKTNGVTLYTRSAPDSGPDGKPFVLFTLECRFQNHTR